jgi:hypothetical protein
MATNVYFRNNGSAAVTNEQRLMEDLMVEVTQIYGEDVVYIARDSEEIVDPIFGEDPTSKFERTYNMEMFISSVENWTSGEDFFSKFGIQVNESTNLVIPRRTFEKYVPADVMSRPREGDLIWIPVMGHLFEIKFVEHENEYFQLGRRVPMLYELKVEKYIFSQEEFDTGIDEIDDIEAEMAYTIRMQLDELASGDYQIGETVYQGSNLEVSTASAEVSNWIPSNNNIDIIDIKGIFSNTSNLIGETSGTDMNVTDFDDMEDHVKHQESDNDELEDAADLILDKSENNPFGMP